eukprot:6141488-Ditylum_brightwellii.AAC.1
MYQPVLIERIIASKPGMERAKEHKTLAETTLILNKDTDGSNRNDHWNYISVIGMLKFLVNSSHPELAHEVHQCTIFCHDPKGSHEAAVKSVIRYLLTTRKCQKNEAPKFGMNIKPNLTKGLE